MAKAKLLSGGNPQIAKGYGDAPVQAWIAVAHRTAFTGRSVRKGRRRW